MACARIELALWGQSKEGEDTMFPEVYKFKLNLTAVLARKWGNLELLSSYQ
jgi:hypothetical protein